MAAWIGRWFPGGGNHFCKLSDEDDFFSFLNEKSWFVKVIQIKMKNNIYIFYPMF